MESSTLRSHLIDEADRLKTAVVRAGASATVPTCPEWTAADLLDHVTEVFDHKIQCMRLLREPSEADLLSRKGSPTERFDAALAELLTEFDDRGPDSLAHTWYGPDQTVGFWIRRMACETVVHRADAELAAGEEIGPVEAAFALDAVEEMLVIMLVWGSRAYREWVGGVLEANEGLTVALEAGARSWTLRVGPEGIDLSEGIAEEAGAVVSGTEREILMWLWRRLPAEAVAVRGDLSQAKALYELVGEFAD